MKKIVAKEEFRRYAAIVLGIVVSSIQHGQSAPHINAGAAQKVAELAIRFSGQNQVSEEDASEFLKNLLAVGQLPPDHKSLFIYLTGWEYPLIGHEVRELAAA